MKTQFSVLAGPGDPTGQNLRPGLIVAIVAAAALLPIIILGVPNGADLANHFRFVQPFYESIRSGSLHPGWLAESNDGFGDPRFRFYPPGLYYLLVAARMLTGNWYAGTILSLVFLSVLGGLGAYFWGRVFFEPKTAMWAGIIYAMAPYRLNEVYQASLLSEYAACAILPFAFAFVDRVCRRKNAWDIAGLAASYAALILTHLPVAVIGSISLLIYALLRLERKGLPATLLRLGLGVLLAIAASAFFWATMLAELSWIKGNSKEPGSYYDYHVNFVFSPAAMVNKNTWTANLLAVALIGFLLPAIAFIHRFFKNGQRDLRAVWLLLVLSFLMATELSRPIWAIVPKLSEIQFPWRWLTITSLAGSLLVAASIPMWKGMKRANLRPHHLAIALGFVLSLVFIVVQVLQDCDYQGRAKFEFMLHDIRGAVSFKDWLPKGANDFMHVERMNEKVAGGPRAVTISSWDPERRQFHIAAGAPETVRVRTYFYPLWQATENGHRLATSAAPDGVLLVSVPSEAADIELSFVEPPRVRRVAFISAVAWISIAGLCVFGWFRPTRKSDPKQ
jgi:4-amino-4-deoxy-L-arabinose transferase-like glycosyltransferase